MATTSMLSARAETTRIEMVEVIRLEYGDMVCLPYGTLRIRVHSGIAWIASSEDTILKAGDEIVIPRQRYGVIVSAVGHQRLSFEIDRL